MTLPIAPKKPINDEIYEHLLTYFMAMIENSPEAEAIHDEWTAILAKVEGKLPFEDFNKLSNMFFEAACHYGNAMFELGIMVALEPEQILALPDDPYPKKEE